MEPDAVLLQWRTVPLHPFWLIVVLAILVILGLPLLLIVLLVAVLANRRTGQPRAYGLRSPDGQWWWDGGQWQPVPPADRQGG
jgi:hypothetical protein